MAKSILILGDGDFSFSASLASALLDPEEQRRHLPVLSLYLGLHPDTSTIRLLCTSFDTREDLNIKYGKAVENNINKLNDYNIKVKHAVDAVKLPQEMKGELFDVIIWNHPHLGVEDAKLHQLLIAHFADSARQVLKSDGRVLLCLVDGQSERWNVNKLVSNNGLHLIGKPAPFPVQLFPTFRMVRNKSNQTFKNHKTQKQWVPGGNDAEVESMYSILYVLAKNRCGGGKVAERSDSGSDKMVVESPMKRARKKKGDFLCEKCDKRFTTSQGLFTHNRQVHELGLYEGRSNEGIKCKDCGTECRDEDGLIQHKIAKHSGADLSRKIESIALKGTGEICQICGYRLMEGEKNGGNIDKHLSLLQPLHGEDRFICDKCGKDFTDNRALVQHSLFCDEDGGTKLRDKESISNIKMVVLWLAMGLLGSGGGIILACALLKDYYTLNRIFNKLLHK